MRAKLRPFHLRRSARAIDNDRRGAGSLHPRGQIRPPASCGWYQRNRRRGGIRRTPCGVPEAAAGLRRKNCVTITSLAFAGAGFCSQLRRDRRLLNRPNRSIAVVRWFRRTAGPGETIEDIDCIDSGMGAADCTIPRSPGRARRSCGRRSAGRRGRASDANVDAGACEAGVRAGVEQGRAGPRRRRRTSSLPGAAAVWHGRGDRCWRRESVGPVRGSPA